ncbi:unnamed protein product, partial [marine sediment metagenome]
VIPYGAAEGTENRRGFCKRVPCGVVSAITPFNFPTALSAHKVAPALAAGNSVVLKPASKTPLAVLTMAEAIHEAGLPPGSINVVTAGAAASEPMLTDPRVRVITFTGSTAVGELITRTAGIKRVHLELGSNSAVTVMADADLDAAMARLVQGPFAVAGQVCISVQKILVHEPIYEELLDRYVGEVERLVVGDPRDEATDVGPMIDEREARRAMSWVQEALDAGGKALCGASHEGALFQPTVLVDVPWEAKVCSEEIF